MWKKLSVSLVILVLVLSQASAAWSSWFTNERSNEESLKLEIQLKDETIASQELLIQELENHSTELSKDSILLSQKLKESEMEMQKLLKSLTESKAELGKLRALSSVTSVMLTQEVEEVKEIDYSMFASHGVEWTPGVNTFAVDLGFGVKRNNLALSVGAKLQPDWGNLLDFENYVPTAYKASLAYFF